MSEMIQCPFCGGDDVDVHRYDNRGYYCICGECDAFGPRCSDVATAKALFQMPSHLCDGLSSSPEAPSDLLRRVEALEQRLDAICDQMDEKEDREEPMNANDVLRERAKKLAARIEEKTRRQACIAAKQQQARRCEDAEVGRLVREIVGKHKDMRVVVTTTNQIAAVVPACPSGARFLADTLLDVLREAADHG